MARKPYRNVLRLDLNKIYHTHLKKLNLLYIIRSYKFLFKFQIIFDLQYMYCKLQLVCGLDVPALA